MRVVVCMLLSCWVIACGRDLEAKMRVIKAPQGVRLTPLEVVLGDAEGISGAALDARGALWLVPERQRRVLRVSLGRTLALERVFALDGVDDIHETEALAWVDDQHLLLGTESSQERDRDVLLLAALHDQRVVVERRIDLRYASLGIDGGANHGVEGACAVAGTWLLALEQRGADGTAAVVMHDAASGRNRTLRAPLTTPDGKLASLECALGVSGSIEVLAIERHFGVARVLAWTLAAGAEPKLGQPRVLIDLAEAVEPLPNFESLVRVGDELILITDNHHGRVTGPTQALRIQGLALPALQKR